YSEDSEGAVYDAEMQNLNNKTVEHYQLPLRTRFYQSAIDTDYMNKGNSYKKLPESNVIFICTFDPFKKGLNKYTFRERCEEDQEILLGDKTTKVFYNCTYRGNDLPDNLKSLYEYVETGKAETDLTRKIETAVEKGRKNEIWRSQYMKEMTIIMDAREEGREEGREAGREAERLNMITDMLRRGKTVEEIVDFCNYPLELVKEVEESLASNV
ncbi:MAG: Rpn family recombination-promoting nuclease/putative transposase, partial [Lachnospiraceae bacterium]|nr:Rpn family recombination-promoting nuclease/putative transposase [Lachnospiraceae bacterium]